MSAVLLFILVVDNVLPNSNCLIQGDRLWKLSRESSTINSKVLEMIFNQNIRESNKSKQ